MRTRASAVIALASLALTLTACSSDDSSDQADVKPSAIAPTASPAGSRHYDSAQAIAAALTAAGLTVSTPKEKTEESYISQVGGTAYAFTVTDGSTPSGSAGINLFPNPETLAAWVPLSKQFGGVAVTADTWAVSLPTKTEAALADSKRLAPKIAAALSGTVQQ
ncbi:hypothetical protein AB0M23_30995 [Streptomyces sp. NPDC052077]|uniref:hypothetical protein n=1 Tax=Streptomyces sp. NPDC052077 TaxID=3154757 RepID=UPI00341769A7